MLFDPFTVVAQIVNFAILVGALKYFLYGRVITAMDEREATIAKRLEEADRREQEARSEADRYRHEQRALADRREELLAEAREEAADQRRGLLSDARSEVDEQRTAWRQGLRRQRDDLTREIRQRSSEEVVRLARDVIHDLADADVEQRAVERALDRLADDHDARAAMFGIADGQEGAEPSRTIVVVTSFEVGELRGTIRKRLGELGLADHQQLQFEVDSGLVLGVEFRSDGTAIGWNAADYLDQVDAILSDVLEETTAPVGGRRTEPAERGADHER